MSRASDGVDGSVSMFHEDPEWDAERAFLGRQTCTEQEYLDFDENQLVEFSNGTLEFPSMPTLTHQLVVFFLHRALDVFISARSLGTVVSAAYKVRLWDQKYREPDLVFVLTANAARMGEKFSDGADLVVEVVSDSASDRERDLVRKREEYAQAGISEYWIVDRELGRITVLALDGSSYLVHGESGRGQVATSRLLGGFSVDVTLALEGGRAV